MLEGGGGGLGEGDHMITFFMRLMGVESGVWGGGGGDDGGSEGLYNIQFQILQGSSKQWKDREGRDHHRRSRV